MIVIDSEFQSLIPPLSDDEYDRLEKSLVKNGYQDWREPIVTWNGTIIDGHNRYHICDEHGIKFKQMEMQFESRDAAKLWIVKNQLKRRNLPEAAIGDLKLEEKALVAKQAEKRLHLSQGRGKKGTPNLGEVSNRHDGETLEILARDIGIGRESLRKLDVIKQKAKEGDPVAIEERQALLSGKKKSIHGAYIRVTGKQKPRKPEETTAPDGRKICVMCGEPISEGEASPARPTVHKKCEQEYQRDWERDKRKQKLTEDGRRICSICGEPINEGDSYDGHQFVHKKCHNQQRSASMRKYRNPTIGDTSEVLAHDKAELRESLLLVVQDIGDTLLATINRYETMGVKLGKSEQERIIKSLDALTGAVKRIKE